MPSSDPSGRGADGEPPASPRIPSFDSLRASPRRSAVDVLTAAARLAPVAGPVVAPPVAAPPVVASGPVGAEPAAARIRPRPAEYADLLPFVLRVASAIVAVPCRLTRWSVTEPERCLRRLLGR